jgi:NAD(P)-dependent dehydrogenase (short-subunit alcohol dehydrogenase family)
MPDRIRLDGRVAVVTGAAGVIGSATLRLLAGRGARIVAVDHKKQELQTAIKDLPASAQVLAVTADVTDEDEVAGYVGAAVGRFAASTPSTTMPASRAKSRRSRNIRLRCFAGCSTSTWSECSWV